MNIKRLAAACLVPIALAATGPANANVLYTVSLDTSSISGAAGDFGLAFQLNDGSGLGDTNNVVKLSNFNFGGGSAAGCPANCAFTGGASGDASTTITLTDNDFFNSFAERFTPGSSLSFLLDMTTNLDAGGVADLFGFSILINGNAIATSDDLGADTFLSVNFDSPNLVPATFAALGGPGSLGAPQVAVAPPPNGNVPEPASILLMGAGLVSLIGFTRRKTGQST